MTPSFARNIPHILTGAVAALFCGALIDTADAATFTWGNISGNFTTPARWTGGIAPGGTDATDILIFGGDVGTTASPTTYIATSDGAPPFLINQLTFQGTTATPGSGPVDTINGTTALLFGGTNPTITQNGTAALFINTPVRLGADLLFTGSPLVGTDTLHDKANITLNGTVSGNFNITKSGTSTFRFGTASAIAVSDNTWFGTLTISDGTIRFNNNAYAAPTALRANPVVLNSATALLTTTFKHLGVAAGDDPDSSLRFGTLSGVAGSTVQARRETLNPSNGVDFNSADITITTLTSGSFAGTLRNAGAGAVTDNTSALKIRGVGTQTFTGTLNLAKDASVGDVATMVITGTATLGAQAAGAIVLNGGTFRLDNSGASAANNDNNRLRDGNAGSTGVETIGGGTFSLSGNNLIGTQEEVSRLQLGSATKSRSGALTINITHNSAALASTSLTFQSYARDVAGNPFDTVNFTANNGVGATLALGAAAIGPRVLFPTSFAVSTFNGLLGGTAATGSADATSVGWATVNGTDFASYGAQGIVAATTSAAPVGTGTGDATLNAALTGNLTLTNAGGYALNSLKIAPSAAGQALTIGAGAQLKTNGILLAGSTDFSITGTGTLANAGGTSPRYFHVASAALTVDAGVNGVQGPVVKSGAGTLILTNINNSAVTQPVVINEGTLRATPGSSLPAGELRFRGGVLEITGGGTFSRQLGLGFNKITWAGVDALGVAIGEEQGSGGFAAVGANAIVDLSPIAGTDFAWEDTGFVESGHALAFGSTRADAKLTWVDNISLTSVAQVVNYNSREFRAIDNPSSTNDVAILSGTISGTVRNDFLKTGNGELILTGNNTFAGATLITNGTLRVNGSTATSFLTDVRDSGTLGGSGTVGGVQVESNGTLAPGDVIAHASILNTSDLKFTGAGAKLSIELGGTTAGGNVTAGYDQVKVTGGVTLNGATLTGSLLSGFTAGPADLFFIIINDGSDAVVGTFVQSTVAIGSQTFQVSYTGDSATNVFSVAGGNDVVLRLIPEPGTASLLILGAASLALRRRRA